MNIAFINGSPKVKDSASGQVLTTLSKRLSLGNEIREYHFLSSQVEAEVLADIADCQVMVFAFPLYVDAIPAHLLNCLCQMETFFKTIHKSDITVYGLVNCGFYESNQNALALEILENWCCHCGLTWGQGVGIGGGGMLSMLAQVPEGKGPNSNFTNSLESFSDHIKKRETWENVYINPNFPRFAYKLAAEAGWRQMVRHNGLKTRDLFTKK